jgi:biofilm PGA synthesis N-glycosyltransferase PgaC
MEPLAAFFWLCFTIVLYTYFLYPILLVILNALFRRVRGSRADAELRPLPSVTFLIPVHNEEHNLARRLDELTRMIASAGVPGEILVISDGSTDRSVEVACQFGDRGVRVIEVPSKQGKAAALNVGVAQAANNVLVFADARQRWADDALVRLIENFTDPTVGAVSGDLVLETALGALAGVGLYWRFEKWLRKQESRFGSQVGVTGAISAVRRPLFHPIPQGTLLDDVFWPMHVVLQGYRVIHDERAQAFDRLPERTHDEFRRKVRTLAGNYQLLTLLPLSALLPWRNRVWWQWVSHKLFRLAVPWALIGMFVAGFLIDDPFYTIFSWVQVAGYGIGLLGMIPALGRRVKLLGAGASFLVLNFAAWLAFWVWITGRAGQSWHKATYQKEYQAAVEDT